MKGDIYYDTKSNIYHLITTDTSLENTVECILLEGYQTQHKFIAPMVVFADYYDKHDERFVKVGGIY